MYNWQNFQYSILEVTLSDNSLMGACSGCFCVACKLCSPTSRRTLLRGTFHRDACTRHGPLQVQNAWQESIQSYRIYPSSRQVMFAKAIAHFGRSVDRGIFVQSTTECTAVPPIGVQLPPSPLVSRPSCSPGQWPHHRGQAQNNAHDTGIHRLTQEQHTFEKYKLGGAPSSTVK